jgi:hypothetical protein
MNTSLALPDDRPADNSSPEFLPSAPRALASDQSAQPGTMHAVPVGFDGAWTARRLRARYARRRRATYGEGAWLP